jgi:hypothetical protein
VEADEEIQKRRAQVLRLLMVGRWLAYPVAAALVFIAVRSWIAPPFPPEWFFQMRSFLECVLAAFLVLPFQRMAGKSTRAWWSCFWGLSALSALFAFARVITVLFEDQSLAGTGEEVGLPAFSGTLIFLVFAQLPIIFFRRFPDQLD